MKAAAFTNDLTEGPVAAKLVRFAVPFLLANVLQTFYNLADMIIVGQVVGSSGLSAIANGGELQNLFVFFGVGFSSAGQILISQYVGNKDPKGVQKTIGTLFTSVLTLSLCLAVIGLCLTDFFLTAIHVPSEAYQQAKDYSIVCFIGIFFVFGYNIVGSILRGMGDSRHPLVFIAISTSLNVVLDLIFVAGLGMGAKGAALATVMGQAVSFIISVTFLYRNRTAFGFDFHPASFRITGHILKMILKLGIPLSIHSVAVHFSMLYVTSYINSYGVAVSAITGVGNKISNVATVVTNALSIAGSAMIGQNFGAGKTDRITKIVHINLLCGLAFSLLLSLALFLWPTQIFRLWSDESEVLALVPMYLPVVILNLVGFALRAPFLSLLNGIGHASMSFVVGMLDGVVFRIGLSLLLGILFGWGIRGFWYGSALAGYTAFFIVGPYYLSGLWKKRTPITQQG